MAQIRQIHIAFPYYGSPRIHQELRQRGYRAGRHRIARLMRVHGIAAKRGRIKTRQRSVPPRRRVEIADHVQRCFTRTRQNQLWFTDSTMIRTGEGWLYAVVILDAFNREVISWSTSRHDSPRTAHAALRDAIKIRRPGPGCVIHSDRGYQFTANEWLAIASNNSMVVSFGALKDPRDNAVMESWFASYKKEELYPNKQPRTRSEASERLFSYVWQYNQYRLHSTLGYQSPIGYATINQQLSA